MNIWITDGDKSDPVLLTTWRQGCMAKNQWVSYAIAPETDRLNYFVFSSGVAIPMSLVCQFCKAVNKMLSFNVFFDLQMVEQTIEMPVIWDGIALIMTSL